MARRGASQTETVGHANASATRASCCFLFFFFCYPAWNSARNNAVSSRGRDAAWIFHASIVFTIVRGVISRARGGNSVSALKRRPSLPFLPLGLRMCNWRGNVRAADENRSRSKSVLSFQMDSVLRTTSGITPRHVASHFARRARAMILPLCPPPSSSAMTTVRRRARNTKLSAWRRRK